MESTDKILKQICTNQISQAGTYYAEQRKGIRARFADDVARLQKRFASGDDWELFCAWEYRLALAWLCEEYKYDLQRKTITCVMAIAETEILRLAIR